MNTKHFTGLALALAAFAAQAQESPDGLADAIESQALQGCLRLEDPQERLTCYDTTLGRTPTGVSADELLPERRARPQIVEAEPPPPEPSAMAKRWELVAQTDRGPFVITPHRPNYLLPVSYNARPNDEVYQSAGVLEDGLDRTELKYQVSFKTKVWPNLFSRRGDLWVAYTQQSFWQAYNHDDSSPFRETNYEPEVIYAYNTDYDLFGLRGRVFTLGLNHMSNGRSDPLSRSWNRVIAGAVFDNGDLAVNAKLWWRLPESDEDDDNPGITDYYGNGEVWTFYKDGPHTYGLMLRSNFDVSDDLRGAVQLDYSHPLWGGMKGYVQLFHGYGDGLVDYDHVSTRASLGLMLTDWM